MEESLVRVERGEAGPEELAAVTAVLMARAVARAQQTPSAAGDDRSKAVWRRLERSPGFRAAHSWQD
ncbi:acyl-CoA carboxylase subunit epsilon [Streptomyces sp. DG2A-72]|uniref:acyl-CoA carboxylase subunit epsilon n=1 Tax=Streptomyces sp. DG2A-72 TaxID=3051386 RepID=UPI00265BC68D|nr:acyl-CoA carboxylase subunit epsilon [Streptomyces sp. DG2A-72]MDO0939354.1 acyl-CoA carboxylase subunit epsilon [Streptomyces sp. DG2A-72]